MTFFPLRETCRKHNEQLYESASSQKLLIHCVDNVISSVSQEGKNKCLLMVKAGTKYADTNGLCILPAALELLYTVTVNINTTDGLINGASCVTNKKCAWFT